MSAGFPPATSPGWMARLRWLVSGTPPAPPAPPALPAAVALPGQVDLSAYPLARKRQPWSVPATGAAAVAAFLVSLTIFAAIAYRRDPNSVPWLHAFTFTHVTAIAALLLVIPMIVYGALRLWLEADQSQFPDLNFAWKAGLTALRDGGLDIRTIPVFVIIGSASDQQERALFDAAGLGLRVRGVPEGPAPLHWYANPDAIYLCCSQASWVSTYASLVEQHAANPLAQSASDATPQTSARTSASLAGELTVPSLSDAEYADSPSASRGRQVAEDSLAALSKQDASEQLARLQTVCQMLRIQREPLCPINGVMVLLPYETFEAAPQDVEEIERAIYSDLTTLQRTLELRCPVHAVLTGFEKEPGFRELMRRVGIERTVTQRFGNRFDIRSSATSDELSSFCAHVCGTFEDWVYALFREENVLSRPGNSRLFALLCKVRSELSSRLAGILSGGFGHKPGLQPHDLPFLFGGCFFAAIGQTKDQQAFIRGVFDKLEAEQEGVEWTPSALRRDRRTRWLARTAIALNIVLALMLVTQVVIVSLG